MSIYTFPCETIENMKFSVSEGTKIDQTEIKEWFMIAMRNSGNNKNSFQVPIKLLLMLCLVVVLGSCSSEEPDFDFFYFVQQWAGAYCDTRGHHCCYPKSGKPAADFSIHGLWPNYADGTYPSNCDSSNDFKKSEIQDLVIRLEREWPSLSCPSSDGTTFWSHEWNKHGTCSESILDQYSYFKAALDMKQKTNLLGALKSAGIVPNDETYNLEDIKQAVESAVGFEPWIECNRDGQGNSQLYQVYLCVDNLGQNLIECPVRPRGNCPSRVQFPSF